MLMVIVVRSRIFKNCFVLLMVVLVTTACDGDTTYILRCPNGSNLQNHPPEIQALNDTSIVFGDTLRLTACAIDPDGDELTYYFTLLIRNMSEYGYVADTFMDSLTGNFWFVPGPMDMPDRSLIFTAVDEKGYSASTMCKVTTRYYIDQAYEPNGPSGSHNIRYYSPVGQEFIPSLNALDIVQLWLNGSSSADFIINIHQSDVIPCH